MTKTLATWLKTRPADTRLQDMSRLLWEASGMGILNIPSLKDYPESYEGTDDEGNKVAVYTAVSKESGCVLGIAGMDLSFMSVFPEPKEGYESYLLSDEAYQEFFTLLGRPGCIRLLRWFCKQKINYYIPSIAAEQIGLSVEECEALMKAMGEASLLFQIELTLPEGTVNAYKLDNDGSIIPFLYFARWVNENERTRWYSYSTNTRKRPWLAASEDREKKKEK